jgi:hypothetical protein
MASLDIYDVLEDPDHPAFRDLGRLLWTLVATPWDWIDRRVETVTLVGERRFRRHMSIDCRVPPPVVEVADELGLDRFFVPLRLVAERPLLSFDLSLDGLPVPSLTRPQNTLAERALLEAAVEQLGRPLTRAVTSAIGDVTVVGVPGAAPRLLGLLGLSAEREPGVVSVEALVRWVITTMDRSFLLLADVPLDAVRHRSLFKVAEELGPDISARLPLLSEIAWKPTQFVFDAQDVVATDSYHFQFIAPDGLMVAGGSLLATSPTSAVPDPAEPVGVEGDATSAEPVDATELEETSPEADGTPPAHEAGTRVRPGATSAPDAVTDQDAPGVRPDRDAVPELVVSADGPGTLHFGGSACQGQVLGVNAHLDAVPDAEDYRVEVRLIPSPDGLLRAAAVSACFSTVLLILAALFVHRIDQQRLESSTALLLVLPGIVSTWIIRPGEHSLVSRLLRGTRLLLLFSATTVYIAAAVVLGGLSRGMLRGVWLLLAVGAAVPAAALSTAVRRTRLAAQHDTSVEERFDG